MRINAIESRVKLLTSLIFFTLGGSAEAEKQAVKMIVATSDKFLPEVINALLMPRPWPIRTLASN
jgi:hypothetical protein